MTKIALLFAMQVILLAGIQAHTTLTVYAASRLVQQASHSEPFINDHYVLKRMMPMNGYHSGDPTVVIVDKGSHSTYVLQLQKQSIARVLTISNAIGSEDTPTPSGRYIVAGKKMDPVWVPPKSLRKKHPHDIKPYSQTHENPLGVAAIFLNKDGLALHGTNEPKKIRKSASHGCIRHSNKDISQLYGMVHVGTPVYVVRQFRNTVLKRSDFSPRKQS